VVRAAEGLKSCINSFLHNSQAFAWLPSSAQGEKALVNTSKQYKEGEFIPAAQPNGSHKQLSRKWQMCRKVNGTGLTIDEVCVVLAQKVHKARNCLE